MSNIEEMEQRQLVGYLELMGYKFTAIPNSTYTTSINQKVKNKRNGLRRGFPDMVIIKNKKLICIEMKRQKEKGKAKGVLSPEQKEWIQAIEQCEEVGAFVCYGFDEAKELIDNI